MKTVYLDGAVITEMADVHRAFAAALDLPVWYGANLDALYDMLTSCMEETVVLIANRPQLIETLGGKSFALLHMLRDAMEENPRLRVAEKWAYGKEEENEEK